jgi:hypothetical protein
MLNRKKKIYFIPRVIESAKRKSGNDSILFSMSFYGGFPTTESTKVHRIWEIIL